MSDAESTQLGERVSLLARSVTALPRAQVLLFCVVRLSNPLLYAQALPYLSEYVYQLRPAENVASVGFYVGLSETLFRVMQFLTVYQWAMLSDAFGRVPLIALGIAGTLVSTLMFGLSDTLLQLLVCRALVGLSSGPSAVYYSVMAELTDHTNEAFAYPVFDAVSTLGEIVGYLIGTFLAYPAEHFRAFTNSAFFVRFPVFLPCVVCVGFALLSLLMLPALKETQPLQRRERGLYPEGPYASAPMSAEELSPPVSLVDLLSIPWLRKLAISNALLVFNDTAFHILFILFGSSRAQHGGLELSSAQIGVVLASSSLFTLLLQLLFMPTIFSLFQTNFVYKVCASIFPFAFAILPLLRLLPTQGLWVWIGVATAQMLYRIGGMYYISAFMLAREYSPNRNSIAATNGLLQSATFFAQAVCPIIVGTLFSWSTGYEFEGYGGYLIFGIMTAFALATAAATKELHQTSFVRLHL